MKLNSRNTGLVTVVAALLLVPAIASAGEWRSYDRGDRYIRSGSRSSIGISIGFGWGHHDRSYGSINFGYRTPVYRDTAYYSPRYYAPSPRVYCPPPVVYRPAPVYTPSYCGSSYYYSSPRVRYYAPVRSYSYTRYDYCAPRYYYGR
jgi:hypothetical protein